MRKWTRSLFFWSLVALFLITVPVVLLRARGYRFDLNRKVFVHSGTITIKSNPQNADVVLNGRLFEAKKINRINNSFNLSGLIPGDYSIELKAEGFKSWSKKTSVHSGFSTEFWNVLLIRENYERQDLPFSGVKNFYFSPENKLVAGIFPEGENFRLKILNLDSRAIDKEFFFENSKFLASEIGENIEWSPDEKFLSIPSQGEKGKTYYVVDLEKEIIFNLSDSFLTNDFREMRWDPEKEGRAYFLSQNSLYRVDVSDKLIVETFIDEISAFDISRNFLYLVSFPNNLIFRSGLDEESEPVQITSNFPGSANEQINKIVIYDDNRAALFSERGNLYIYNRGERDAYFKKVEGTQKEAHFSNDGKKLLFWNDYEISVYFVRDEISQPKRQENEIENITRYSEPIKNVQWFSNYENIIFSSGKNIKIIELDPRDKRNCLDIINLATEDARLIYDENSESLFFTDQMKDTSNLFFINFPEKETILGI